MYASDYKETIMTTGKNVSKSSWTQIPNGTKVRLAEGGIKGVIDGVTEFVIGALRNPDGRSQYRVNVGNPLRMLVAQQDLVVLTDAAGLVLIHKANDDYRRYVTGRLCLEMSDSHFAIEE